MAAGDHAALHTLYLRYGPSLLAYLIGQLQNRSLAEEILQDVMMAAWKGAVSFRGDSKVYTWLLVIARNRAITARKRLSDYKYHPLTLDTIDTMQGHDTLEAGVERRDEQQALRQALQKLPVEQRETLELIFYHDLSAAETAAVLQVASGTVKSRLHRAKTALRKLLEGKLND